MAAAGSQAESARDQTVKNNQGKYIALVEGSVPIAVTRPSLPKLQSRIEGAAGGVEMGKTGASADSAADRRGIAAERLGCTGKITGARRSRQVLEVADLHDLVASPSARQCRSSPPGLRLNGSALALLTKRKAPAHWSAERHWAEHREHTPIPVKLPSSFDVRHQIILQRPVESIGVVNRETPASPTHIADASRLRPRRRGFAAPQSSDSCRVPRGSRCDRSTSGLSTATGRNLPQLLVGKISCEPGFRYTGLQRLCDGSGRHGWITAHIGRRRRQGDPHTPLGLSRTERLSRVR
jgi:hypothetical protein